MCNGVVLLASYNGSKYIEPLIASIDKVLDVAVSDDASADDTCQILADLKRKGLFFLPKKKQGSASANFSYLINEIDASYDYYFLADQDDVWVEGKLAYLLDEIKQLESRFGCETPLLVFSDSAVVNEDLGVTNRSFLESEGLDPNFKDSFKLLCCQNVGQGATFVFNKALLKRARPIPTGIIMHDWWLMLVASAFGKIGFVDRQLLLYRQHSANVVGASGLGLFLQLRRFLFKKEELKKSLYNTQANAALFLEVYRSDLPVDLVVFLEGYSMLRTRGYFYRKWFAIRYGLRKTTLARTLGFYSYI